MFYVGMTACAKVWLQPLYMVDCCHHHYSPVSPLCTWLSCKINVLHVLATLILLSFTKIYCTVVLAMKFTTLYYPVSIQKLLLIGLYTWMEVWPISHQKIWQHIYAAVLFLLLAVPYILLYLMFDAVNISQELGSFVNMQWITFKPFIDAYHGPYKTVGFGLALF